MQALLSSLVRSWRRTKHALGSYGTIGRPGGPTIITLRPEAIGVGVVTGLRGTP